MYDILQLNDMLVPELLDIAEELKIPNAKKLSKQDLVYKILDGQAIANAKAHPPADKLKGKRKRIIKTSTGLTTEEAIVEDSSAPPVTGDLKIPSLKKSSMPVKKNEKPLPKRGRKKHDETETNDTPIVDAPAVEEEEIAETPEVENAEPTVTEPEQTPGAAQGPAKFYPP